MFFSLVEIIGFFEWYFFKILNSWFLMLLFFRFIFGVWKLKILWCIIIVLILCIGIIYCLGLILVVLFFLCFLSFFWGGFWGGKRDELFLVLFVIKCLCDRKKWSIWLIIFGIKWIFIDINDDWIGIFWKVVDNVCF